MEWDSVKHPEEYLELCRQVYELQPNVVWKMLFLYPYEEKGRCTPNWDIDTSFYWSKMPEGSLFWSSLHDRLEGEDDAWEDLVDENW